MGQSVVETFPRERERKAHRFIDVFRAGTSKATRAARASDHGGDELSPSGPTEDTQNRSRGTHVSVVQQSGQRWALR